MLRLLCRVYIATQFSVHLLLSLCPSSPAPTIKSLDLEVISDFCGRSEIRKHVSLEITLIRLLVCVPRNT